MARKQRNNVDYFPHPVTHGKKMSYLEKKYQNDGYATWFKILEELGAADYHYLDLSDEVQIMFLSDRCLVTEERLISIINDLVKLKEFNKELWVENKVLFNEKFVESVNDAYKKRSNQCITESSLLTLLHALGVRKQEKSNPKPLKSSLEGGKNPQRIGKDRKGKEIKEEESKEKTPRAIDILEKEKQSELDVLWMQNKNQIPDKKKLIDSFNAKMELELAQGKINFEAVELMPRFKGYVIQWISNTNDDKSGKQFKKNQQQPVSRPNYF